MFLICLYGLLFIPHSVNGQSINTIQLAQILARSDTNWQHLTYSGVFEIKSTSKNNHIVRTRVWKYKDKFYHLESITPPETRKNELRKREHPGISHYRREISHMPNKKYFELLFIYGFK